MSDEKSAGCHDFEFYLGITLSLFNKQVNIPSYKWNCYVLFKKGYWGCWQRGGWDVETQTRGQQSLQQMWCEEKEEIEFIETTGLWQSPKREDTKLGNDWLP